MKKVFIIRAIAGKETEAAEAIAKVYNEAEDQHYKASKAVATAAGTDVVYTIYAETYDPWYSDEDDFCIDDENCVCDCDDDCGCDCECGCEDTGENPED